jgi:L-ornithine N5-oxygenase
MAAHTSRGNEILDVLCIGFGPASLSLAIALHEQPKDIKVRILDRKPHFSWRGNDFPNGILRMRTNLIHDLVSQRNPQSHFTFVNYLWHTGTLVSYLNLGLLHPPRCIFSLYLNWCARQIEELGWTQYGTEVNSIEPVFQNGRFINHWRVDTSISGGTSRSFLTKKVVIGVGSQAIVPRELIVSGLQGRIQHSARFGGALPQLQQMRASPLNIAIVGANCDAVEMIEHCQAIRNDVTVTILLEEAAFRQTDDNPL